MSTFVLFLHILAALWLAAGSFAMGVVRAQTARATDLRDKVFGLRLAWRLSVIFAAPGGIVAGLLGFYLVTARGFGFSATWVRISSVLYLAMLAVSLLYMLPHLRATLRAAEASLASGVPNADLLRLSASKLPSILGGCLALGIVVLTLLMTLKP